MLSTGLISYSLVKYPTSSQKGFFYEKRKNNKSRTSCLVFIRLWKLCLCVGCASRYLLSIFQKWRSWWCRRLSPMGRFCRHCNVGCRYYFTNAWCNRRFFGIKKEIFIYFFCIYLGLYCSAFLRRKRRYFDWDAFLYTRRNWL